MYDPKQVKDFHKSVIAFKNRAHKKYPHIGEDNDNGEWVFCDEFDRMCDSFRAVAANTAVQDLTSETIEDLLYTIARDNECPMLINEISSDLYRVLCKAVLDTPYTNAKWEFAETLKDHGEDEEIRPLIFEFLDTGDEYTERMALRSLAFLYPEKTEEYAEKFWSREIYKNDEYQKIMVLHALNIIGSSKLSHYLDMACRSSMKYLKENADAIRAELEGDNR